MSRVVTCAWGSWAGSRAEALQFGGSAAGGSEAPAFSHVSVLAEPILDAMASVAEGLILDVTLGGGGHSYALLERFPNCRVVGFDRDEVARNAATKRLSPFGARARVVAGTFEDLAGWLEQNDEPVRGLIADLGVSSPQLDQAERGMSFRKEGPLDMRMDRSSGQTAAELIAGCSADELADLIYEYGEERRSRRIARCIKLADADGKLATTLDLRRAVVQAVGPARVGGVDPATRTFQALRIAVNGELDQLKTLLQTCKTHLDEGVRVAMISFHSLEDRLVKRAFMEKESFRRMNKKPIVASDEEKAHNPRSRSAKLRVADRGVTEAKRNRYKRPSA